MGYTLGAVRTQAALARLAYERCDPSNCSGLDLCFRAYTTLYSNISFGVGIGDTLLGAVGTQAALSCFAYRRHHDYNSLNFVCLNLRL